MIYIDKRQTEAPKCLTEPDSIGIKERDDVIKFYSNVNHHDKEYTKYKAYKEFEVKQAFNILFRNKCAYCESNYAKVQPVDVEHYRPKGGVMVDGVLKKPGYYWLASDWDNLLPSCIDCNRERTQQVAGSDEKFVLGKANLFPIVNEFSRASKVGYEGYEVRLLLNPCIDKPEEHLSFREDGTVQGKSFMGLVSIETFGLHRKALTDAREEHAKRIRKAIADVMFDLSFINDLIGLPGSDHLTQQFEEKLKSDLKVLKSFLEAGQEYIALAREMINPFIESYKMQIGQKVTA